MPTLRPFATTWIELLIGAGALLALSYVPFVGFVFVLLFSDYVLMSVSAISVLSLRIRSKTGRVSVFLIVWFVISVNFGFLRLFDFVTADNDLDVYYHPAHSKPRPAELAISGVANPIVSAQGRWWEAEPELNVAGMRSSWGLPLANATEMVELPAMLSERGIEPRIDGRSFPRFVSEIRHTGFSERFTLQYFDSNAKLVATYSQTLLPFARLSESSPPPALLAFSVFHWNFWRATLGLTQKTQIRVDVDRFMTAMLGVAPQENAVHRPARTLALESEQLLELPADQAVHTQLQKANTAIEYFPGATEVKLVCGTRVVDVEMGVHGPFTKGQVLKSGDTVLLTSYSPDDAAFAYYCDQASGTVSHFSSVGSTKNPTLKIRRFDTNGKLLSVDMFGLPRWLDRRSVIIPGSMQTGTDGGVLFQLMEPVSWVEDNHEKTDDRHYRLSVFSTKISPDRPSP